MCKLQVGWGEAVSGNRKPAGDSRDRWAGILHLASLKVRFRSGNQCADELVSLRVLSALTRVGSQRSGSLALVAYTGHMVRYNGNIAPLLQDPTQSTLRT